MPMPLMKMRPVTYSMRVMSTAMSRIFAQVGMGMEQMPYSTATPHPYRGR